MKLPLITALITFAGIAGAAYTLDWTTMDAGGGASKGGAYTVTGTIGQTDPGVLTGGRYALSGGFWAMPELLQTPGGPPLRIEKAVQADTYLLAWPAPSPGWVIQTSEDLENWYPLTATPSVIAGENRVNAWVPSRPRKFFFRLALP
jgi:hypothetical protein